MSQFNIIEIQGHWVVAIKSSYDEDDERTIIGAGQTKDEAMEQALAHTVDIQQKFERAVDEAAKCLNAQADMDGLGISIEVPGVSIDMNGETETQISAISCNDEQTSWGWYFR